ncbi:acyl-CoA thioesterase [uncultured Williamsia sp.]|uniref:acyl-CoA thioesterase n=1 Tax=uncultured Williamsia sp. TaxID=259311 RepID=UPI002612BD8E|nr:acyl-CoA thioesterase [uncultured Williamsia sp.]
MSGVAPAFVASIPVRWSDAGASGLLATAQLVTVMEEARVAWLLSAGEEHRPLITSAMIVTVDLTAHRHLTADDGPIRVAMWIDGFRSVDFTIGYALTAVSDDPDAPPAYTATTQMAVVDVEAHTLRRLTDDEKATLRAWSRTA